MFMGMYDLNENQTQIRRGMFIDPVVRTSSGLLTNHGEIGTSKGWAHLPTGAVSNFDIDDVVFNVTRGNGDGIYERCR